MSSVYALGSPSTQVKATPETLELPVQPPVQNLPAAIRKVQPDQQRLISVADIAEHDRDVAATLRSRLDFTDVIEGGACLSVRDAYAVLSPKDFARFECISKGFSKRESDTKSADVAIYTVLGLAAAGAAAMGIFTSVPVVGQVLIDCVGGLLAVAIVAAIADGGTKSAGATMQGVGNTLKALPAADGGPHRPGESSS